MSWFECKISYENEITGEGKMKKVSETYLLDAETFTDAEARMTEQLEGRGSFVMETVKKVRYAELFLDNKSERFYKAKVGFINFDEKAGIEKKKFVAMLIQADTFAEALDNLNKGMKGTMSDYEIAMIQETPILEVLPYEIK